jgi:uncharacterized protein (TIGR03000 family)
MWYAAHLLIYYKRERSGKGTDLAEESIVLIEAADLPSRPSAATHTMMSNGSSAHSEEVIMLIRQVITLASAFLSASILLGAQPSGSNRASGGPSSVVPGGSASNKGTSQTPGPWSSGHANPTGADSAQRHTDSRDDHGLPQSNNYRGYRAYRPPNWAGFYGYSDYGYFSPYPDPATEQADAGYPTGYGPYETADYSSIPRDESVTTGGTSARITIATPAGTEIWVNDTKVASPGGRVYTFPTPPLEQNRRYTYTIRAQWLDHEQKVTQSQEVAFAAGAGVMVRFPKPAEPGK